MCFRPPTIEMDENPTCPKCGADVFIGAMKCPKCGEAIGGGPVAAKSAPPKGAPGSADQTSFGGAKTTGAPAPPSAPGVPGAPAAPPHPPAPPAGA
ncbi:MAG: hypothetical protein LBR39_06765 [Coriobacteriales bacterium]|jgi:hypothetical protein|nr:hypothetical protein [Coriobacteriales bacterium]